MSNNAAIYLIAVNGGMVAQKTAAGIYNKTAEDGNTAQQWTVEYGDSENKVAFQNVSTGQWLHANVGSAAGKVDLGDKQWWSLEQGRAPGSCWIKCLDYPDAYLCNSYANYTDNNLVYMWPKQLNWTHSMLWYFADAKAPGFKPKDFKQSATSTGTSGDDGREQDLARRESALKKREQDLAAKGAEQAKTADQLKAREQELNNGSAGASAPNGHDATDLQEKLDQLRAAERDLAAKEAAMKKREQQSAAKEDELKRREAALAGKSGATAAKGASEADLLKVENENLKLQLKLKEMESQLAEAKKTSPVPTTGAETDKLRAENARLKNLIAQQIRRDKETPSQPSNNSNAAGPNGATSLPHTANTSKPVTAPSKTAAGPTGKGPQAANTATGKSVPGTGPGRATKSPSGINAGPDNELERLRQENARLKQAQAYAAKNRPSAAPSTNGKGAAPSAGSHHSPAKNPGSRQPIANGTSPAHSKAGVNSDAGQGASARPSTQGHSTAAGPLPNGTLAGAHPAPVRGGIGGAVPDATGNEEDDAVHFNCGHVAYPPPRKIQRKMVGILYE